MKRYICNNKSDVINLIAEGKGGYPGSFDHALRINQINPRIIDQEIANKMFDINYEYINYIPYRYQTDKMIDSLINGRSTGTHINLAKINPKYINESLFRSNKIRLVNFNISSIPFNLFEKKYINGEITFRLFNTLSLIPCKEILEKLDEDINFINKMIELELTIRPQDFIFNKFYFRMI